MTVVRPFFRPAVALAMTAALALSACGGSDTASAPQEAGAGEAAGAPAATGTLAVANATLRLNPNAAAPSAAYFILTGGTSEDRLVSVSSPDAARAEMHESKMEGGMMTMTPIDAIPVPANGTVEFRQGGKHIMLFDISAAARSAGKVKLVLTFASGATLEAEAVASTVAAAVAPTAAPAVAAPARTGETARAAAAPAPAAASAPAPAAVPEPAPAPAPAADHSEHGEHSGH